jgi:hypothetical protein
VLTNVLEVLAGALEMCCGRSRVSDACAKLRGGGRWNLKAQKPNKEPVLHYVMLCYGQRASKQISRAFELLVGLLSRIIGYSAD